MQRRLGPKGFEVLVFPTKAFKQEYASEERIKDFLVTKYTGDPIPFTVFSLVDVNGKDEHPVYTWLKAQQPDGSKGKDIRHNFAKFAVDRTGQAVDRWDPKVRPLEIEDDINALLAAGASSSPAKKKRGGK